MQIMKQLGWVRIEELERVREEYNRTSKTESELLVKSRNEIIKLVSEVSNLKLDLKKAIESQRDKTEADLLMESMKIIKKIVLGEQKLDALSDDMRRQSALQQPLFLRNQQVCGHGVLGGMGLF